jgi:hypothetical protein
MSRWYRERTHLQRIFDLPKRFIDSNDGFGAGRNLARGFVEGHGLQVARIIVVYCLKDGVGITKDSERAAGYVDLNGPKVSTVAVMMV